MEFIVAAIAIVFLILNAIYLNSVKNK